MSKQQQRRADKQRRRQKRQEQRRSGWSRRERPGYGEIPTEALLGRAALALAGGLSPTPEMLAPFEALPGVDAALDRLIAHHWVRAQADGWDAELGRHCARRLGATHAARLLDGQPCELGTGLELVAWLLGLPELPAGSTQRLGPDEARLLDRVRALLAKAESTEFPDEAEALTAKAQDLVSRHSLQQMLTAGAGIERPGVWHCPIDDPYAEAKSLLLAVVARANRCQAVYVSELGFSTVLGFESDLRATEVLFASLLVQATRALTFAGTSASRRLPSYRRSFLVAYAQRIGERLDATTAQAQSDIADDRLLPVLARRNRAVTEAVEEAFPGMTSSPVSASNGQGWAAGRWAADQAELFTAEELRAG